MTAQTAQKGKEVAMERRTLGRTGLTVSVLGFGSWPMSGEDRYGAIEDAEAILAIHRALDAGVNCVDTAAGYGFGHAEEVVGRALAGHRDQVILATKCGLVQDPGTTIARRDISRSNIVREAESSLRRLHTDVIDVYLIHWPTESTPIEEAFQAMDDLVRAGKVRFIGVSNFTVEQMERCRKVRPIDVVQVGYHLFDRRMEQEVFPYCERHGIGVMGYGSLAHGLLTGTFTVETRFSAPDWRSRGVAFGQPLFKPDNLQRNIGVVERLTREVAAPRGIPVSQIALAWVLRNPVIATALVGARTPAEVEQNLAGLSLHLTAAEIAKIDEIMRGAVGTVRAFTPLRPALEEWE
jgi:aryl-alcohol dehydrogenase-like predicted oxidoreductase